MGEYVRKYLNFSNKALVVTKKHGHTRLEFEASLGNTKLWLKNNNKTMYLPRNWGGRTFLKDRVACTHHSNLAPRDKGCVNHKRLHHPWKLQWVILSSSQDLGPSRRLTSEHVCEEFLDLVGRTTLNLCHTIAWAWVHS